MAAVLALRIGPAALRPTIKPTIVRARDQRQCGLWWVWWVTFYGLLTREAEHNSPQGGPGMGSGLAQAKGAAVHVAPVASDGAELAPEG